MKLHPALAKLKQTNPQLLRGIPERKLQRIAKGLFGTVCDDVVATEKGRLKIPGLGTLRIRVVEMESDGHRYLSKRVSLTLPNSRTSEREEATSEEADSQSDEY